jgi:hypothetical protein
MPASLAGPDGRPIPPAPPKRPWTTPRLAIHGTIPSQTYGPSQKKNP